MFNPKITIIIPLYNCEKYIEQCIDSVYSQTYKNIEVICMDNESTDNSYNILKKLRSEKYPELIIDIVPNIYPFCWDEVRDKAMQIMTGDYVIVMGSDDYLEREFINNYVNIFSKAPNKIMAIQSAILGVNNIGDKIGITKHAYSSLQEFKTCLLSKCVVNTPTVMYNTKLYKIGLLNTDPKNYSGAADYNMYCNIADKEIMIYPVPQWLGYYYRWHEGQATWGMHKSNIKYDELIKNIWAKKWIKN